MVPRAAPPPPAQKRELGDRTTEPEAHHERGSRQCRRHARGHPRLEERRIQPRENALSLRAIAGAMRRSRPNGSSTSGSARTEVGHLLQRGDLGSARRAGGEVGLKDERILLGQLAIQHRGMLICIRAQVELRRFLGHRQTTGDAPAHGEARLRSPASRNAWLTLTVTPTPCGTGRTRQGAPRSRTFPRG